MIDADRRLSGGRAGADGVAEVSEPWRRRDLAARERRREPATHRASRRTRLTGQLQQPLRPRRARERLVALSEVAAGEGGDARQRGGVALHRALREREAHDAADDRVLLALLGDPLPRPHRRERWRARRAR